MIPDKPSQRSPQVDPNQQEEMEPGGGMSGKLVRLFVGGLPLGLVIMGALSFVIWNYKKREKPPTVLEFASMLQRDVNAEDFNRYVHLLLNEIGTSELTDLEKKDAVAGFVESSMGMENMGYETRRRRSEDGGWLVYSELPAGGRSKGVLLVITDATQAESDRGKASTMAALMSVAQAMTGKGYGKLVRFAVVSGEGAFQEMSRDVTRVLEISSVAKEGAIVFADADKDTTAKLKQLLSFVESAAQ